MARSQPRSTRGGYWRIRLLMLLSFLSIASAVFVVCLVFGVFTILLFMQEYYISGGISVIVAIVILAWILVPRSYRFLARAFPLKASGEPDSTSLRFLRRSLATMLVVSLGLAAGELWLIGVVSWVLLDAPSSSGTFLERSYSILAFFVEVLLSVFAWFALMLWSALLLFSAGMTWSLITLIRFHKSPAAWASKGFILFLRSFGSVSDSAAFGFLATGASCRWRVALLSSPKEVPASWDPLTLAVAGSSFLHPFHSVPVYLESTDRLWADDVGRLASAAELVVIDTSHRSPGLSQEMDILSCSELSGKNHPIRGTPAGWSEGGSFGRQAGGHHLRSKRPVSTPSFTGGGLHLDLCGFRSAIGGVTMAFDYRELSLAGRIIQWSFPVYSLVPAIWVAAALSPEAGFIRRSSAELVRAIREKAESRALGKRARSVRLQS
jgi:hypothetical protein